MYQLLDLFSGIGGFSLGLERSGGFKTVAFCEIDPFCHKILAKHWPQAKIYDDVRAITESKLRADGIVPDAICGGFPCQDISVAGKGAGIRGGVAASGLNTRASLARFDRNTSSWKTSQLCLLEDSKQSSVTWTRSGMTQNGTAYQLPTLVPGINGTEFGFLPTPRASARGAPLDRYFGSPTYRCNLEEALRNGPEDPICQNPDFVEEMMGFPENWTRIETERSAIL